jgi:hypothetical protein
MTFIRNRRTVAAIAATACLALPASAAADSLPATYKSDAAQSGAAQPTDRTDAAQSGWVTSRAKIAFPADDFRGGDSPADHPGASRAPDVAPTTIEVVRPERTIVRDVDEALPIALAGSALLLVLATRGITLVRARLVPRPGRSN